MLNRHFLRNDGIIEIHVESSSSSASSDHISCTNPSSISDQKDTSLLKCPICELTHSCKSELYRHGRDAHLKQLCVSRVRDEVLVREGTLTKCPECNFIVKRKGRLTRHLMEDHGIVEKITCDVCGKECTSHRALQHHISQFHTYINIQCHICGNICKNRAAYQRHVLMHGRSFTCEQCGKTFNDRRCYTQHLKIHIARTPFKCPHCEKTFTKKSNMINHVKIQHYKVGAFSCDLCQFSTFYKDVFNSHVDRVHRRLVHAKYICSYCSKSFAKRLVYDEHIDKHEGRYRYNCQFCAKKFRNKARCKSHGIQCAHRTQDNDQNSCDTTDLQNYTHFNEDIIEETVVGMGTVLL